MNEEIQKLILASGKKDPLQVISETEKNVLKKAMNEVLAQKLGMEPANGEATNTIRLEEGDTLPPELIGTPSILLNSNGTVAHGWDKSWVNLLVWKKSWERDSNHLVNPFDEDVFNDPEVRHRLETILDQDELNFARELGINL
ncbi:hypothetical protein TSEDIMI_110078 [Tenacibaculum sediminilitoris]|uniref:hypothetical protein n=1 Tax=Tenacibaculum sediminilitoris TaxID=1820334 RepID=UPI003892D8CA